jgi:hypothetical protein
MTLLRLIRSYTDPDTPSMRLAELVCWELKWPQGMAFRVRAIIQHEKQKIVI